MLLTQRPVSEQLQASDTASTSCAGGFRSVCAVPLFGGPTVSCALLLETEFPASGKSLEPKADLCLDEVTIRRLRCELLRNPTYLHQLGLIVMIGLSADMEHLQWLACALRRLSCCDRMDNLVWELCDDLASHVKRRYIVEASTRAALLPRVDAALGLLFQTQTTCSTPRRYRAHDTGSSIVWSPRSSMECSSSTQCNASQAALSVCTTRLASGCGVVPRNPLNVQPSTAAAKRCGQVQSRRAHSPRHGTRAFCRVVACTTGLS